MKKRLLNLMFTALTLSTLASLNAVAKADTSVIITDIGSVEVQSEDRETTAIKLNIDFEPVDSSVTINDVSFQFTLDDIKVYEYRINDTKNQVTLYIAHSKPIFKEIDTIAVGKIFATDADGNEVAVRMTLSENALEVVSGDNLETEKDFEDIKGFASDAGLEKLGGTRVKVKHDSGYVVNIPSGNETLKAGQTFNAGFTDVTVESGTELKLSVESKNGWVLKDESIAKSDNAIPYKIKSSIGDKVLENFLEEIVVVKENTQEIKTLLTVESVDAPKTAGNFKDTLTFHVSVERPEAE